MKKGILLTLASYTTAILILLLAILVFHNTQQAEERFSETIVSDRTFDLFTSVEKGIKEIFDEYFPLNLTIEVKEGQTDVSFKENITKSKEKWQGWKEDFVDKLNAFINYVNKTEPRITIKEVEIPDREFVLTILPHNIDYYHSWQRGFGYTYVEPEERNFNSYDLFIYTNGVNLLCPLDTHAAKPKGDEEPFTFNVVAFDGTDYCESNNSVSPTKQSHVKVDLEGGDPDNDIFIKLDDLILETMVKWEGPPPITITTKVDELEDLGEEITIEYLMTRISVDFSEFNFTKNSTVSLV